MKTKIERKYDEKVSFEVGSIVTYSDAGDLVLLVTQDNYDHDSFDGVVLSNHGNYKTGELIERMTKDFTVQFHGTITIEV